MPTQATPRRRRFRTDRDSLERDTEVDFFTASGPGGQHRNRSRTGVRLRHRPSGVVVTATERRSQAQNLQTAFRRLTERLDTLNRVARPRKSTRPTQASQQKRLRTKAHRAAIKRHRRKPGDNDGK